MGLRARVFKTAAYAGCSNGGLSSRCDEVTLVNVPGGNSTPTPEAPPALLVAGAYPGIVKVVPAVEVPPGGSYLPDDGGGGIGPMMGGAYVATPDARFAEAVEAITGGRFYGAVALHDRFETPEHARQVSV